MTVYLLQGDSKSADPYEIKNRADQLLSGIQRDGNLNFSSYDLTDSETTFPGVVSDALTLPFFGGSRTVLVKNMKVIDRILRSSSEDDSPDFNESRSDTAESCINAARLLRDFPDNGLMILMEENDHLDGRTAFMKALKEAGCKIETFKAMWFDAAAGDIRGAVEFIKRKATEYGIRLEDHAAETCAFIVGPDRGIIEKELEKLSLYGGGKGARLTVEDVENVVTPSYEAGIFHLVDTIGYGKTAEAIKVLNDLMDRGAASPYILTMIARQLRLIALAREEIERGAGTDPKILAGRLGQAPFTMRKVLNQTRRFPAFRYPVVLEWLMETDLHLKRGTMPERLALETLITKLANPYTGHTPGY